MNDIVEDDETNEPASSLPTWVWSSAIVLLTLALLWYLLS